MSVLSTTASARPAASTASDDFLGHPKGVYVCFFTEMWERFSFYGMKALLLLYLLQHHKFGDRAGLDVLGAYGGLVYCVPVIGGLLADRFLGMRKAVIFGGLLLVAGHAGMAFEGHAATTVNGVVTRDEARTADVLPVAVTDHHGRRLPQAQRIDDRRPALRRRTIRAAIRASRCSSPASTWARCSLRSCAATSARRYGWKYGFGAAGIGMLLGLVQFLWGRKYLRGVAEPPAPLSRGREWTIYGWRSWACCPWPG